jgi:hypothetical protein
MVICVGSFLSFVAGFKVPNSRKGQGINYSNTFIRKVVLETLISPVHSICRNLNDGSIWNQGIKDYFDFMLVKLMYPFDVIRKNTDRRDLKGGLEELINFVRKSWENNWDGSVIYLIRKGKSLTRRTNLFKRKVHGESTFSSEFLLDQLKG